MKKKILSILLLFCGLSFAKPNIKINGLSVNKGIDENIPAQIAIFTGISAVNITICFCLGILFLSMGD